jgi:hypothetical protein
VDWHSLTDIATVVVAVVSTWMAARRELLNRIEKNAAEIAELRGILKGAKLIS